jgi:hypothetical protein
VAIAACTLILYLWNEFSGSKEVQRARGGPMCLRVSLATLGTELNMGARSLGLEATGQGWRGFSWQIKSHGLLGTLSGHLRRCSEQQI